MKYTLAENIKHILNEKYILDERYILSEAAALTKIKLADIKTAATLLDKVKKLFKTPRDTKQKDKAIAEFENILQILDGELAFTQDIGDVKGKVLASLNKIEQLAKGVKIDTSVFFNQPTSNPFSDLRALASSNTADKDTLKKIKETVKKLTSITNALTNANAASENNSETNARLLTYVEAAETAVKQFYDFAKANKLDDPTCTYTLQNLSIETDIANCIKGCNSYIAKPGDAKLIKENSELFIKLAASIQKEFAAANYAGKTVHARDTDWEARFKSMDANQFWDEYYTEYWTKDGDRIRALGKTFRDQCEKLGFTDKTNPFITFLKTYLVKKNYNITEAAWVAINNGIVNKVFNTTDLTHPTNKACILYCQDFYTKSGTELEEYVKYYSNIILNIKAKIESIFTKGVAESPEIKSICSHLFDNDLQVEQFLWLILYNESMSFDKVKRENASDKFKAIGKTLRPLTEIEYLIRTLDPDSISKEKKFTTTALGILIDNISKLHANPKPLDQAKYLRVLISKFLLETDAESLYKKYAKINSAIVSGTEEITILKNLYLLGNKMTKDDVIKVIDGVEAKLVAESTSYTLK